MHIDDGRLFAAVVRVTVNKSLSDTLLFNDNKLENLMEPCLKENLAVSFFITVANLVLIAKIVYKQHGLLNNYFALKGIHVAADVNNRAFICFH